MGLFNKFPYTNFHEVNTDWIVKEVRAVSEQVLSLDSKLTEIQDDVNSQLQNINATIAQKASDEVKRLVDEGRFDELITPALEQLGKDLQDKTQYLNTLANKSILIIGDSNSDESFTQDGNVSKHWTTELKNILSSNAKGNGVTVVNRSKAGSKMDYAKTILTEINATT